jgi:hypothetical protein
MARIDLKMYPGLVPPLRQHLSVLLSDASPPAQRARSAAVSSAVASLGGRGGPLGDLAVVVSAAELPPCRLSTQQLVELLKMPTCVGEARRVVLDYLGKRYGRCFADQWEFVRFAQQQRLDLDFTSPPKRPE